MFSYNPGVQDRSGEFIAAGIQRAMGQIGEGVQEYRKKQADKEAELAAIDYGKQRGWFKDDGEGKAAVKAAGGGRAALALASQVDQMERQEQAQAAAAREAQLVAETQARMKAEMEARERSAVAAALGQGNPAAGTLYQDSAVAAYLAAGGDSKTTLDAFGRLPTRPVTEPTEGAGLNFVEDPVTGARFAMGPKGNFASSGTRAPAGGAATTKPDPMSPSGKLLADADRLRDEGRKDEADALRDQAMDLRVSETQRMQIDTARRQVADLGRQIAEIDERMAAGDTRDGLPVFGTKLTARREELVGKLATKEGEVERLIQNARRPLGSPNAAQPAAAAPAAQQFTKGQRVRQNGVTYEYDGANWNPVN